MRRGRGVYEGETRRGRGVYEEKGGEDAASTIIYYATRPQQFLYFLPLPQGQGSLRPTLGPLLRMGSVFLASPLPARICCSWA